MIHYGRYNPANKMPHIGKMGIWGTKIFVSGGPVVAWTDTD